MALNAKEIDELGTGQAQLSLATQLYAGVRKALMEGRHIEAGIMLAELRERLDSGAKRIDNVLGGR